MSFLKKVPGFRSGTKWKMAVAIIGYLAIFSVICDVLSGNDGATPTTTTAPTTTTKVVEKTPEQLAQEKATATKISVSDKELLKKSYASLDAQQLKQYAEIKNKVKVLSNAEVADISADFARISHEEDVENKKQAEAKAIADKQAAYQAWIDDQFSLWDGSNRYLVDLVKEHLNDPKSFDHAETTYKDMGDYIIVKMTYRAKNAFGGLILQNVTAKSDYKTQTISIVSQND